MKNQFKLVVLKSYEQKIDENKFGEEYINIKEK